MIWDSHHCFCWSGPNISESASLENVMLVSVRALNLPAVCTISHLHQLLQTLQVGLIDRIKYLILSSDSLNFVSDLDMFMLPWSYNNPLLLIRIHKHLCCCQTEVRQTPLLPRRHSMWTPKWNNGFQTKYNLLVASTFFQEASKMQKNCLIRQ